MAKVFYSYIVNAMNPQNPEILQINLNTQKERRKLILIWKKKALWDKKVLFKIYIYINPAPKAQQVEK